MMVCAIYLQACMTCGWRILVGCYLRCGDKHIVLISSAIIFSGQTDGWANWCRRLASLLLTYLHSQTNYHLLISIKEIKLGRNYNLSLQPLALHYKPRMLLGLNIADGARVKEGRMTWSDTCWDWWEYTNGRTPIQFPPPEPQSRCWLRLCWWD